LEVARINQAKYNVFRWRYELNIPKKLALALGIACLTGLAAQIRIPVPWSPVPVTGQTFAVLLAGVVLGRWWGGISLALYAGLGAAGLPWFNGGAGGISIKYIKSRSFFSMLGLMLFANFVLIYVPGLIQLHFWLSLVTGEAVNLSQLLMMGTIPFIAGDITKAMAAAAIARGITPKLAYNGEVDSDKWASWRLP
jgi:biotin transport system substrate-specific component